MRHLLDDLHAPHAALLRAALALASPPGARLAVDIGCGPGLKAGWLAERLAPGGLLVGVDIDRAALAEAARLRPGAWVVGDARDLPMADRCAGLGWCVAALDLFGSPDLALSEARRVLGPGGTLVVASAAQLWARPRPWPAGLVAAWAERAPPPPADGLGDHLAESLLAAGFAGVYLRAYLLDPPGRGLAGAALPLAGWDWLAARLDGLLAPADLAACAAAEAEAEPEPLAVLLVAAGSVA
ncbi:class I SAM-dependent methyltransferase [Oscillochloris sp. ZM17-4]|uniref:class I SAM-dependent methyltransferase n=1 Tax=Oscillochloris sp. ZM17-4 TaxID=2866714 RepID=UPI001C72DFC7|nr:class I SAM-dependent methyltransferase [Oscillochloris sp. ZM17-4]MBX0327457.1 class I SAM-dependent methyltransferase [Oscillochloris sp. ZM17-4]